MWKLQKTIWTLWLFAIYGSRVLARDICSDNGVFYTYCEDGYSCCHGNTRCCSDSDLNIGAIIGAVIGGLVLLSCCCTCVGLAVMKITRPGRVVSPEGPDQPGVTVVSATPQYPGGSAELYGQPNGQSQGQQFGMGQPPAYEVKNPGPGDPAWLIHHHRQPTSPRRPLHSTGFQTK